MNFDDMKAETGFGHVQLRRLSTKPAVSPRDHALSTQWVWYWLDEGSDSWKEYGSELMVGFSDQLKQVSKVRAASTDSTVALLKFEVGLLTAGMAKRFNSSSTFIV